MRYASARTLALAALLAAPALVGCNNAETFTLKPSAGWDSIEQQGDVQLSNRRDAASPEYSTRGASVGNKRELSMAGVINLRQDLATLAGNYGMTERPATEAEAKSGYSEIYARDDGTSLQIGENPANRYLYVKVLGPQSTDLKEIKDTIRARFAQSDRNPASAKNAEERMREDYGLSGRLKPKKPTFDN